MLQQTQTSRVIAPWTKFVNAFPTPTSCANAPLSEVLRLWSGLGYHRRAKALHDAATMVRDVFDGAVPGAVVDLRRLPGVGEYTANAVASFAFGQSVAVVDTNCDPDQVTYPIAGNDDAIRAVKLITSVIANTVGEAQAELGTKYPAPAPAAVEPAVPIEEPAPTAEQPAATT